MDAARRPPFGIALARFEIAAAAAVSDGLAARVAFRQFATPRRFEAPEAERVVLASARPFRVEGLAAWRWGAGPTVLLAHGWEGRGGQLGAFVAPIVARGFSVVAFDSWAHGVSPGRRATLGTFSDSILTIARRIGAPHAVVAHSLGALGTLLAIRRGLRAESLVLVGMPSPAASFETYRQIVGLPEAVVEPTKRRIARMVGVPIDDAEGASLVAGTSARGLVIHDADDREQSIENSRALARAWAGSELLETAGLGHRRILKAESVVTRAAAFV
ncbi:MAG TPA: alpha/beta fold hydrolase [Polyangiaceae bacterium]|nr:alpha/beta fold hydrolase [Polyangiaceae bacterium]